MKDQFAKNEDPFRILAEGYSRHVYRRAEAGQPKKKLVMLPVAYMKAQGYQLKVGDKLLALTEQSVKKHDDESVPITQPTDFIVMCF